MLRVVTPIAVVLVVAFSLPFQGQGAAFFERKLSFLGASSQTAAIVTSSSSSPTWIVPRGGAAQEEEDEDDAKEGAEIEEVLYLPGLLDVELTASKHVSSSPIHGPNGLSKIG